jgi:hypothetical protein
VISKIVSTFEKYYIANYLQLTSAKFKKKCSAAIWPIGEDALKINGYENNLTGLGTEIEEFATRLINNSIYKIKMKHYGFVPYLSS